jgi:hypothetical protein
MKLIIRGVLIGCCVTLTVAGLMAQSMPKTTKETITGTATQTTQEVHGTVLDVEGNTLVVKLANGQVKTFTPPASRRFNIDGKDVGLQDLRPGTKLTATVTTTTTPVTERTTTIGTGKVFFVAGNNVILTLPNNENRQYKVKDDYRFIVDGKKASVYELRKGMVISAEKIVEEPSTEIATNTVVTGSAPPAPKPTASPVASNLPAPAPAPAPAPRAAPKPAAPAPAPAPAEVAQSSAPTLPKTAGPVPLVGLLGFLLSGAAFGLRTLRRAR